MNSGSYTVDVELKRRVIKECAKLRANTKLEEKEKLYYYKDLIQPHSSFHGIYGHLTGKTDHNKRAKKLLHLCAIRYAFYNINDNLIPINAGESIISRFRGFPQETDYVREEFSCLEYYLCYIYDCLSDEQYREVRNKIVKYICNLKQDLLIDEL